MNISFLLQFVGLIPMCAPDVSVETMAAVVEVESGGNPLAIGVVGARLKTPPTTLEEAVATAEKLEALGKTFSVGLGQINAKNLAKLGLSYEQAFDPCTNLQAASKILSGCYQRAQKQAASEAEALNDAFSCYYSGNFERGYQRGPKGEPSYVEKVRAAARPPSRPLVPSLLTPPLNPLSWSFVSLPVPVSVSALVEVQTSPLSAPEASLLVPRSVCSGVVLGSPCSVSPSSSLDVSKTSTNPASVSAAPAANQVQRALSTQQPSGGKEAPITKSTVF